MFLSMLLMQCSILILEKLNALANSMILEERSIFLIQGWAFSLMEVTNYSSLLYVVLKYQRKGNRLGWVVWGWA
ncbi:hypothetical protein HMPREF2914_14120 [Pseudomonas sp. HMSC067G02]|nr:hypothetical protein X778_13250 [Pseudomonas aeruginosa VRFPA07]OES48838.1 hypothetical protein A7R78_11820 [Pseudomonas aeruginosa]OFQ97125.1 hypothetical protein HMPREF2914_14120 [Pseudomonas sp. HMSC067G02]